MRLSILSCWILFTCRIWHHRHPIFSSVGRWPGRFDHLSRQRWSENATLLTSSCCSDYIFHTWPLSLTKDNWLGSLRSASAMAESPEDRLSLPMIGCCTPYTQEASHLGEPDAVCDGPCPRVPVVLVLWVPPLGEQQHREAVLFAGEPETNLAWKKILVDDFWSMWGLHGANVRAEGGENDFPVSTLSHNGLQDLNKEKCLSCK